MSQGRTELGQDLLSADDGAVLTAARDAGVIAASLYEHGDFSETGFLLYGRLERLCTQGLLRFERWTGDPMRGTGRVEAVFSPASGIA
jgi:hypothetical protein